MKIIHSIHRDHGLPDGLAVTYIHARNLRST